MPRPTTPRAVTRKPEPSANADYLFVGFNRRVVALDRLTGELKWKWKASAGTGVVSVMVDRGILFACVSGYTYALDPSTGEQLWSNPLQGLGMGIPCLATLHQSTVLQAAAAAAQAQQEQSNQASASHTVTSS
jgi:glucose dehydrogenase